MTFQYVFQALVPGGDVECSQRSEYLFGPISKCRYDFTLFFEQFILSGVPGGILVLSALPRLLYLSRQHEMTLRSHVEVIKLVRIS